MLRFTLEFKFPGSSRIFLYLFVLTILALLLAAQYYSRQLTAMLVPQVSSECHSREIRGWQQATFSFTSPGGVINQVEFAFQPDRALAGSVIFLSIFNIGGNGEAILRRVKTTVPHGSKHPWLTFTIPSLPTRPGSQYRFILSLPELPLSATHGLLLGDGNSTPARFTERDGQRSPTAETAVFRVLTQDTWRSRYDIAVSRCAAFRGNIAPALPTLELPLLTVFLLSSAAVFCVAVTELIKLPTKAGLE